MIFAPFSVQKNDHENIEHASFIKHVGSTNLCRDHDIAKMQVINNDDCI